MKKKKKKTLSMRIPLPEKTGGFHSGKKGKKGYDRKKDKRMMKQERW